MLYSEVEKWVLAPKEPRYSDSLGNEGGVMDLNSIAIRDSELETKLMEYADSSTSEHRKVRKAYKTIETGVKIVDLPEVISRGGQHALWSPQGELPKLGFVRAGAKYCHVVRYRGGTVSYYRHWFNKHIQMPIGTLPRGEAVARFPIKAVASVPIAPPSVREQLTRPLREHFEVFEAQWKGVSRPSDPALLYPIVGTLYEVVAMWDVTGVEAAALR